MLRGTTGWFAEKQGQNLLLLKTELKTLENTITYRTEDIGNQTLV